MDLLLVLEAVIDDEGRLVYIQVRCGLWRARMLLSKCAIDKSLVALVLNHAQMLLRESTDAICMIDILVLRRTRG